MEMRKQQTFTCDIDEADVIRWLAVAVGLLLLGLTLYFALRGRVLLVRAIDRAFDEVDMDGNHMIDLKEMHAAVLLLYLNLNYYVYVLAPSRDVLTRHFVKMAGSEHGELDRVHFQRAMATLAQSVFSRLTATIGAMLATPFVSPHVVDAAQWAWSALPDLDQVELELSPCREKVCHPSDLIWFLLLLSGATSLKRKFSC